MSMPRIAPLLAGLLLAAVLANAGSQKDTVRITVLDSVTQALTPENNGVPLNCEQLTFDAYCRSTTNVPLLSTLLVQEDNQPPFRISCTVQSKYSRCVPLAKGESFDAKKEKHGLDVYYVDDRGKTRKQFYTLVGNGKAGPPLAAAAVATPPAPAAAAVVTPPAPAAAAVATPSAPAAPAPRQSSPVVAPAPPTVAAEQVSPQKVSEKVKCNFSSTPPGAEITVDGNYLGSTPSEIPLSTGTHVVIVSMPGFTQWKRELTVSPGAELTVAAVLQKQQP
jgi:hypothetical protein